MALTVETDDALTVRGNRELVGQTIANLIDNALKYAAPNDGRLADDKPEIVIRVRRAGGLVELTVADHGPGIAAADRARSSTVSSAWKAPARDRGPGSDFRSPPRWRGCMGDWSSSKTTSRVYAYV